MKSLTKLFVFVALIGCAGKGWATPPLEYITALRDASGKVTAGVKVVLTAEITSDVKGENVLYSETQQLVTSETGLLKAFIGEGQSYGSIDDVDWSEKRYLKTSVIIDGADSRLLGVAEIAATPKVLMTTLADRLIRRSSSGAQWQLKVTDAGEAYWEIISDDIPDHEPAYDQNKVPENLYFVGSFNNWNVNNAIQMIKHSKTRFSTVRYLNDGEIFKFVPTQSWQNDVDWSSASLDIGSPNKMKERGNCPEFHAAPGNYEIMVDFYDYTLTLTPQ